MTAALLLVTRADVPTPFPSRLGSWGGLAEGSFEDQAGKPGTPGAFSLDRANCLAAGPLVAARAEVALEGGWKVLGVPLPSTSSKPHVKVR